MFELKGVTYGNIVHISQLSIPKAKVTCLFGPSGCGKTTLLCLLNGLISPDKGEILYDGMDLSTSDLVVHRRSVVMLAQQSTLFPGNVRENLNKGAFFQERPPFPDQELTHVMVQTGLDAKSLEDNPELFSGGEKQRLALGRILLLRPPVLLLDEPGAALDLETETIIMKAIRLDQQTRKSTCVLVTHSKEMAETYGDSIVYMKEGSVLQVEHRSETEKEAADL